LGAAGQGTWAAAVACLALVLSALQQVRLAAARSELGRLTHDTEAVLNSLSGGLLTVDLDGRIRTFNPAAERILGLAGGEVRGRGLRAAFAGRAPLLHEKLERSLRDRAPIHRYEMPVSQTGGTARPIGLSTSVLRTAGGEERGLLVTFQDLSDVRRMQERVRRADRLAAVGELAASIAHEIRNPLAAIANSTDMLRDELPVKGEQRKLMDLIVKESERLNRILDDFLEYARVRPLQAHLVPVAHALDEVVTLLRCHPDIGDDLAIQVEDRTDGRGSARVDEAQMKQVYVNLALNAFEAMGHSGTLTIVVEPSTGDDVGLLDTPCVRLRFRDTGPGVAPGEETAIFEPFHTTKPHGTGLGLSIASRIVESHGGRIDVATHPEGGAEFSVYLPDGAHADVVPDAGDMVEVEEAPAMAGARGSA
jgi:two-component system sensor histidine kinase PilS (NtrC family)